MRTLGRVVGRSRSGHWIVKGEIAPAVGATVVNREFRVLGRVNDVFGPASKPYISVGRQERQADASPGDTVYCLTPKDRRVGGWRVTTR